MGWFTQTLNSSLGKKYIMSITGLFLIIFLVIHLFGNMFLYIGRDAFNAYVDTLGESAIHYVILVIEVVLFLGFFFHAFSGIKLTLENFNARPNRYAVKPAVPQSTFSSRTMWVTASVIFIFLVVHLQNFWYAYKFGGISETTTMYDIVTSTFQDPVYASLYLVACFLLGFHLWHGFQSAFQSLGLNHKKYRPIIVLLGRIYAIVVAGGFASLPVYFYFLGGR